LIKKDLVTEEWLCVEVLSQLPSEFWASTVSLTPDGFTVEQVEAGLRRVFGDRSKKDISQNMDRSSKQAPPVHVNVVQKKRKYQAEESSSGTCFYCLEAGHFKTDCPTMKKDRDPNRSGGPLFRSDIKTAPGGGKGKAKVKFANVVKVKPVKKVYRAKVSKATSSTTEDKVDVNALLCETQVDAAIEEFPDGTDVPMSECGSLDDLEVEVSRKYRDYLLALKELEVTNSLWIVDTGAGHGISSDKSWFKNLNGYSTQTFVYGNKSTSKSTKKGTVHFSIFNAQKKLEYIKIDDVAHDTQCGSNLLSAWFLAKQGYRFLQSACGSFLYFFGKGKELRFAAVAIGEVYYLPTKKFAPKLSRSVLTVKTYTTQEKINIFKEWHLRLGHVNRESLMRIMSTQSVTNIPQIRYAELQAIPFFCETCALSKSKRMSYKNMTGTKTKTPLHTLHMDTMGKMRVCGFYGGTGYKYPFAVVDDATGYKWYFVLKSLEDVAEKIKLQVI
jgi:hypothetical protein